ITTLLVFTVLFISALLVTLFFLNRRFSKNIWLPFKHALQQLKAFDVSKQNKISFDHSNIAEFEELNKSLSGMTERISADYHRLKEFTEDASHEIQTPLSVIRSKLELLMQADNFPEEEVQSIQKISEAVTKLSRLNIALLTLTKIENRQFSDAE